MHTAMHHYDPSSGSRGLNTSLVAGSSDRPRSALSLLRVVSLSPIGMDCFLIFVDAVGAPEQMKHRAGRSAFSRNHELPERRR